MVMEMLLVGVVFPHLLARLLPASDSEIPFLSVFSTLRTLHFKSCPFSGPSTVMNLLCRHVVSPSSEKLLGPPASLSGIAPQEVGDGKE